MNEPTNASLSYELSYDEGGTYIVCLECGHKSHNAEDIRTLFCDKCWRLHSDPNASAPA